MKPTDREKELNIEKLALTVLAAVIVTMMTWVGLTVSQNQLQYAVIQEKLANQTLILVDLQSKSSDAAKWRASIDSEVALIKQRLKQLENK